jgi:hypothetical protein
MTTTQASYDSTGAHRFFQERICADMAAPIAAASQDRLFLPTKHSAPAFRGSTGSLRRAIESLVEKGFPRKQGAVTRGHRKDAPPSRSRGRRIAMLVPDTLEGALVLSAIDFFLSFVVIAGIGCILAAFPMLSRVAKSGAKDLIED